jgi:hypothetical protein
MQKPDRNTTEPTWSELNREKTRAQKNPAWSGRTEQQQQDRVYMKAKARKRDKQVKEYTRSITKKHRIPTDTQKRAAEYNYRTTTGVHPLRTKAQARGYIEGYTDGLNELDRGKKIRTIDETAQLMEKRFDEDRGGEDRTRFDQTAPKIEAPY